MASRRDPRGRRQKQLAGDGISRQSVMSRVEAIGIAEGLELCGRPALVLDGSARVVFTTTGIARYLGKEFDIVGGVLRGINPDAEAAFAAITPWARNETDIAPPTFLIDRHGRPPLLLHPLRRLHPHPHTLLSLTDLSYAVGGAKDQLTEVFGLTGAEGGVVGGLGAGKTVAEIARERGVEPATVRGQLKSIFRKLDIKRQSELVRLIDRLRS